MVMEAQVLNLEKDKKYKPKTEPQITDKLYAKWLTDKYNSEIGELKTKIKELETKLKIERGNNKTLRAATSGKRLKYMNDKNEFSRELMKDDVVVKYKREIDNLQKAVIRLKRDNANLIAENIKLKNFKV